MGNGLLRRVILLATVVLIAAAWAMVSQTEASLGESLGLEVAADDPDGQESFVTLGVRWASNDVTYAFANCPTSLDCGVAHQAVREAFGTWSASCGINFIEAAGGGDVMVSWQTGAFGLDIDFDGPGGYLAIGRPPYYSGGHPLDGDIFFDDQEAWYVSGVTIGGQYDLRSTALHEIGHAVGLNHSSDASTIMWASQNGMTSLSPSDVAGCQSIYGV